MHLDGHGGAVPLDAGTDLEVGGRRAVVVSRKGTAERPIVRLDLASDREGAEALRGCEVTVSAGTLPATELGSKMLLLDNWNEWGEGHYIAPYREFGFGYLDAVRKVFGDAPEPHVDLIPEDIGMGPYDTAYKKHMQEQPRP